MNRKRHVAFPRSAIRFQSEFLDFQKGIRVGHLDDNQRITRILKLALEARHQEEFVTERFGRGVYWQWIGFVFRPNRAAKPVSSKISFGCAKFFLTIDSEETGVGTHGQDATRVEPLFKCGFSVERGLLTTSERFPQIQLQDDWDWHRLLAGLTSGSPLEKELRRLVAREGFSIDVGNWDGRNRFTRKNLPKANLTSTLKGILTQAPPDIWTGFQVYYPMSEKEVRAATGLDLVESMMAVFGETTRAMNLCMQVPLENSPDEIEWE
ncbi:MAG: hypothetical protein LBT74_11100 [Acidobacteriota bacterium]|nr:hypothetical protein [Acidobacteriota bacterium]